MLRNFSVPAAASGWLVACQISLPLGVDIINNEIAYAALAEPISSPTAQFNDADTESSMTIKCKQRQA
jgi:hypothetical protein